jgi:DNA invertase Pin-like site-specific DNA recombinase
MARTSNRAGNKKQAETINNNKSSAKIYKAVIYARLSNEDDRKITSHTVDNQISLLRDYIDSKDDMELVECYCDRGFSGTNFARPDFMRMIDDMKKGKFNCIVVKDLSRLGRNYLEVGNYLEKIFPMYGIRFICASDGFDSLYSKPMEDGMLVPLKNLINEAYAKDISKRVSISKENQQKLGEFIGAQPPLGYVKAPENCHHLIPDPDAMQIIKDMFAWRLEGKSVTSIAGLLNKMNVPSPVQYRIQKGMEKNTKYKDVQWDGSSVACILRNVVYIGDMEQGYQKGALYKGIPDHRQKKEQRIYVKGTHEPIVDKVTFYRVQELMDDVKSRHMEVQNKYKHLNRKEDIFKGLLYCNDCDCKLSLYRRTVNLPSGYHHYYTYICRNTSYREECTKKNMKMEKLEEIVKELINLHIALYMEREDMLHELNQRKPAVDERKQLEQKKNNVLNEVEVIEARIQNLYEDLKDDTISEAEYLSLKADYVKKMEVLKKQSEELDDAIRLLKKDAVVCFEVSDNMKKYSGFTELTPEIIRAFIKRITFFGDNRIEVEYTFTDQLEQLEGLIAERKMLCGTV